jgi:hypothetical protein
LGARTQVPRVPVSERQDAVRAQLQAGAGCLSPCREREGERGAGLADGRVGLLQIHGKNYLMDDLSIECYTPTHSWYQSLAVVGVVLYPVGIPLAFLFLLFRYNVPQIARHKRRCHALRRVLEQVLLEAQGTLPLLTR